MSLRTCPDCGKDVSSCASACPHCGRPRNKSRVTLELTAGLCSVVVGIIALSWHSGWQDDMSSTGVTSPDPKETVMARPYRHLQWSLGASIGYNRTLSLFRVENRDMFPWTHCELSLNSKGISGYDLEVESIKPGLMDAALLQSAEFTDSNGKSFDPSAAQVTTLDLSCDTPGGHLYYGGRFAPIDSGAARALAEKPSTSIASALVASTRSAHKP